MIGQSVRLEVVAWFAKSPDEELKSADIALKMGLPANTRSKLVTLLEPLVREEWLQVRRSNGGNLYSAGRRLK